MSDQVLRGRVVTAEAVLPDGVVVVDGNRISHVGVADEWDGDPGESRGTLLPGLVDVHDHGGGGHAFPTTDPAEAAAAARHHHRHGSTTVVASLVTAAPDTLVEQVATLVPLVSQGLLAGIHLEGPFLSRARCGAQDPAHLRLPDLELTRRLLDTGGAAIVWMTLAPELPGYSEVSALLRDAGVLVALGHSDAGHQVFADELSRLEGRGLVTHVGNAMPPLHHRAAGPVAASLSAATRGEGLVELIADGVHTDAGFVDLVFATAAPGCVVLVTDAMAAAGMPDGRYALGGQDVTVVDRVARLSESATQGGSIAGGTAHLVEVVATCVRAGVPLADAVRAASRSPARVLGIDADRGVLAQGAMADVLVVDEHLRLQRVMRSGAWLAAPEA